MLNRFLRPIRNLFAPLVERAPVSPAETRDTVRPGAWSALRNWLAAPRPVADPTAPHLQVADVDLVYTPSGTFDSYYFQLVEREGRQLYTGHKVVKLLALDFVPLEAREQLAILEKMRLGLRGLYNAQVDFVYLVAGMFQPVYLGITQCYGVIGYDAESRAAANEKAECALGSLRATLANFEQSRLKLLSRAEVDWIRQAFWDMRFGLVGLGHPDPSRTAQTMAQQSQRHGLMADEFTLEQNELLYRGMALLSEEFLNIVMAYRVAPHDISMLQDRTAREASRWASMEKGTKGINLGLGVPIILSNAFGHAAGTNYGESQNVGVSDVTGHGVTHAQALGVGHTVAHGEAHTDGVSDSVTVTEGVSGGHTNSVGDGTSQGVGHSDGVSHSDGTSHMDGQAHTDGVADTTSHSHTEGQGSSTTDGWSHTDTSSWSDSSGAAMSAPINPTVSDSVGGNVSLDPGGVGVSGNVNQSVTNPGGQYSVNNGSTIGGSSSDTTMHSETSSHMSSDTTGQAHTDSHADTTSHADGVSHSDGKSQSDSTNQGQSHNAGQSDSSGWSRSVSRSHGTFASDTTSRSEGDSVSASESAAESNSQAHGVSRGLGASEGRMIADTSGMGVGAGLSPNLSVSKSYAWEDHNATLIAELLRGQEQLLRDAVVEGAFLTDNYYFCRTDRGRQALAALFAQAFTGTNAVTPAQTRPMADDEFEYLRNCAMTFTASTRREAAEGRLQTYRDAELLTPLRLAAYTAVGLVEAGRATTVQERIPPFAFNPRLEGEVVVGYQVMFETGETTNARCRLSRDKMAHIGLFADTGAGKSVLATWLEYQIATQWEFRVVILDFGRGHRALMNIIPPERFNLYGLDETSPRPIRWNPLQIGRRIRPQTQLEQTCQIVAASGRMGQRQNGFMRQTLRDLYLENGVLTFDREVQFPEQFAETVHARPTDPLSLRRIALARVEPGERAHLDAARAARGAPPLPAGAVPLSTLPPADLQALAVERSKAIDLSAWYDRLKQIQSTKKSGQPDHTALEGVLLRLEPFRFGTLATMYGSGEGSIAIEDLAYPYGVAVLEGGSLAEAQKAMILGLAAFHIYENSVEQRKETMETQTQQEKHPMLLVLEEAHKIINGVSENSGSDASASQSSGIISAPLWGNLARDGRKYHVSYMLIGQSPAEFPEAMVTSCNIFGIGTLKGDKDRKMMLAAIARSTMGFEDNPYLRFLSRIERARMIWKTQISMDRKEVEPILIETIMLPVREPSDPEVAEHFKTWGVLLENLKRNVANPRSAAEGGANGHEVGHV